MKLKIDEMAYSAMFTAFLAIGAFIKVPISIVPITLQTLVIVLAALLLKRKVAMLSVCLYITVGLLGIPILANGGGLSYVFQPTFGYLLGFVIATWVISTYCKNKKSIASQFFASMIGIVLIYGMGIVYFVFIQYLLNGTTVDLFWVIMNLCVVFLPGDIISAMLAITIAKKLRAIKMWN